MGCCLKNVFENEYDKVNLPYLQRVLCMKIFAPKWCEWITQFVQSGRVEQTILNTIFKLEEV